MISGTVTVEQNNVVKEITEARTRPARILAPLDLTMKTKILIAIASLVALAHLPAASATTVPAGTVIVVRVLPITTTGAYLVDNQNFKTKHGTSVSRVGYSVPLGRHLHFKLAQPLQL